MSALDSNVARVLDNASREDEDDLIAQLEESDSPVLDGFRERRIAQLHAELARAKQQKSQGYGVYTELQDEKTVMDLTTEVPYAVLHFAKDDFARCSTMDTHLQALATKHTDTRFLKIKVDHAPYLVTKLNVRVLPCVIAFKDGISVDRIIGFEGLGYTADTFTTKDLEARLISAGVLLRATAARDYDTLHQSSMARKTKDDDDEDDDDWD